jgi:hypothetical protein
MKKYYGNYLGIVVNSSSNDPEGRNRVQIWVPQIMNTLFKNWNNDTTDKKFYNLNFSDPNNNLSKEEVDRLRNSLPWAECAAPLIGGGSAYTHNVETGYTSVYPEEVLEDAYLDVLPDNNPAGDLSLVPDIALEPTVGGGSGETIIRDASGNIERIEPALPSNDTGAESGGGGISFAPPSTLQ